MNKSLIIISQFVIKIGYNIPKVIFHDKGPEIYYFMNLASFIILQIDVFKFIIPLVPTILYLSF